MFNKKKDCFSIRKYKVGVGSVFLGSFLLIAPQVYAETGKSVSIPEGTAIETSKQDFVGVSTISEEVELGVTEVADVENVSAKNDTIDKTNVAKEGVERVAATVYKVVYIDKESGEEVYSSSHSVSEKTTLSINQPKDFRVLVDVKTDLKTQATLKGYKLAEDQPETQVAVVTERGGRKNLVNINVVRDKQTASGNNKIEGYTGFRTIPTTPNPDNIEKLYTPSSVESAELYRDESGKDIPELLKNLNWLDWGDSQYVYNLGVGDELQVGTYYEKELFPGYIVKVEVVSLKPFNASETFHKRVEGTEDESAYNPNATNSTIGIPGTPKRVLVKAQNGYSNLKQQGVNAGHKPTVGAEGNGGNVGVQFKLTATYNGKKVPANFFVATGEEARGNEAEIFVTDGEPFELLAEIATNPKIKGSYYPATDLKDNGGLKDLINKGGRPSPEGYKIKYVANINPEKSRIGIESVLDGEKVIYGDGIGTRVAGPNVTVNNNRSVPILVTRNAENVELYIMSRGQQSLMMGVIAFDEGDAPESYGSAPHLITNTLVRPQPFLGTKKADLDYVDPDFEKLDFETDDRSSLADEGVSQLVGAENVHVTSQGKETYSLHRATDTSYTLKFKASSAAGDKEYSGATRDVPSTAYAYAWADFNNNGKFDEGERSELVTVNGELAEYQFTWNNVPQMVDPAVRKIAIRARIANKAEDIAKPTGVAYSGEVEDFEVQVTHPPRGDKEETSGYLGETQMLPIEFKVGGIKPVAETSGNGRVEFTAYGRLDYDLDTDNSIADDAEVKIVSPTGDLVDTWTEPGQGTYTVAGKTITFRPEATFTGTAKGVALRVSDKNMVSTDWSATKPNASANDDNNPTYRDLKDVNDGTHTLTRSSMDAVYIPRVINNKPKGTPSETEGPQGVAQTTDAKAMFKEYTTDEQNEPTDTVTDKESLDYSTLKLIGADGQPTDTVTVAGQGTYTLANGVITFQPLPNYTGTATPVEVQIADASGDIAKTTYTPTVEGVTPVGEDKTSIGKQGQKQEGTPTFTEGDPAVPVNISADNPAKFIDPKTGKPTEETELPAMKDGKEIGKYTLDPTTGKVTFTPNKDFVGTPDPITVEAKDANGTPATAKFTPTVIPNTPPTGTSPTVTVPQGSIPITDKDLISSVIPNDKEDGKDVSVSIKDNPVDYNVPGVYEVTFIVTDKDGLTTEVKKTIFVTPKPGTLVPETPVKEVTLNSVMQHSKQTLPKTGDSADQLGSVYGAAALGLSGLILLGNRKRKE
ncbi:YSIRK-type signal peptide-containing protein [Carnobacteriaceae bacterium zg-ZUI240]|nr:YSIRK-type signal peptide-containing protein [Carnobacteriaceae bacterium zg-ZUI240]